MIVQLMTASPAQVQFHLMALIAETAPGLGCVDPAEKGRGQENSQH
jgi:hypothetical protein